MKTTQLNNLKRINKDTVILDSNFATTVNVSTDDYSQVSEPHNLRLFSYDVLPIVVSFKGFEAAIKAGAESFQISEEKAIFNTPAGGISIPVELMPDYIHPAECESYFSANGPDFIVHSDTLKSYIPYISKDHFRPAMNGIFFDTENNKLVATNAHILRAQDMRPAVVEPFILPGSMAKILSMSKLYVNIFTAGASFNNHPDYITDGTKIISCEAGGTWYFSMQIDEKYPNWRSVWPTDNPGRASVDKAELLSALNTAKLINETKVKLSNVGNVMSLQSENIDTGQEFKSKDIGTFQNFEALAIGFRPSLIEDILKNDPAELVTFTLSNPNRAAIVNGHSLLMPMMINN